MSTQSPGSNIYSPNPDNINFKSQLFSVPGEQRFPDYSSMKKLHHEVPIQYLIKEPGQRYSVNKVAIGFGSKVNCVQDALKKIGPGPDVYDVDKTHSMVAQLS